MQIEPAPELLKKFRKYADMTGPVAYCDCKTCERLQRLFAIEKKFRRSSGSHEKVLKDLAPQDRFVVERALRNEDSRWRECVVKESHRWESQLDNSIDDDTDYTPASLDL